MTIHDFDMVRFLAGCNATEVYVEAAVLVDPAIGEAGDVDTAVITLKMENGAIAVIDNSRKAAYGYDQRAEVFGSKGMVAVSNDSTSSAVISNADGVTGEKPLYFFLSVTWQLMQKRSSASLKQSKMIQTHRLALWTDCSRY